MAKTIEIMFVIYFTGFIMTGLAVALISAVDRPNDGILEIGMLGFFYAVFWPLMVVVFALGSLGKVLAALLRMG